MPILPEDETPKWPIDLVPDDLGLEWYFASRFADEWSETEFRRTHYFNTNKRDLDRLKTHFKEYPLHEKIPLRPKGELLQNRDLSKLLKTRETVRQYSGASISLDDLATILRFGNGLKADPPGRGEPYELEKMTERCAPSGGQRFPLEVYIVSNRVDGLPPGLFHYNLRELALDRLDSEPPDMDYLYGRSNIDFHHSACTLIITAVFARTILKYGLRGWRILFLEAGMLAQNIWLAAHAMGIGVCPNTGGFDGRIGRLLQINSHQEGLMFTLTFGRPKSRTDDAAKPL